MNEEPRGEFVLIAGLALILAVITLLSLYSISNAPVRKAEVHALELK